VSEQPGDAAPSTARPRVLAFSAAQRRGLVLLLSLFIVAIAIILIRKPVHVDDPMPTQSPRYEELVDRLDPNTADVATLSALPQLGPRRAKDIVDYRERVRSSDPSRVVFAKLDDLLRVRGVGAAMLQHLEPYLSFPTTRPTTGE
jgi:competence protein ComEA